MSEFKKQGEVFRWSSNNAVVPPIILEQRGMVFNEAEQQKEFLAMAERFTKQFGAVDIGRMFPKWHGVNGIFIPTTPELLVMFSNMSLGKLVIKP